VTTNETRERGPMMFVVVGVALAVLLLVVMVIVDRATDSGELVVAHDVDLDSIAIPGKPTAEEVASATAGVTNDSMASLRGGAWIQVADEDGTLAQEYRAERIDPLPEQWIDMVEPSAMVYPASGRVIAMDADRGRAFVPSRAMESGVLKGNVVIRIFEPRKDGSRVDPRTSSPSMTFFADVAEFDNVQGSITSDQKIRVETDEITFQGIGLAVQLGVDGHQIERLIIERATAPIELRSRRIVARRHIRSGEVFCDGAWVDSDQPPPAWYELVLHDDVKIEQHTHGTSQLNTVSGDRLVATFALGEGGVEATFAGVPLSTEAYIASLALGVVDQSTPEDAPASVVYIHYTGRLVMTPDETARLRMRDSDDGEVVVEGAKGSGVAIHSDTNQADIVCAELRYRAATDTVEFIGSTTHALVLDSPRMHLTGERFWLARAEGVGGVLGAGRMVLVTRATPIEAALGGVGDAIHTMLATALAESHALKEVAVRVVQEDDTPSLEITWSEGIDLDFVEGDESAISQARFRGDVAVASESFNLASEALVVEFAGDPERPDAVERIFASGGASVDRPGSAGSLHADSIDLALQEGPEGSTIPRVMLAKGGVEASDPAQKMWAEELLVHFEPLDDEERAERAPQRGLAGGMGGAEAGPVRITTVSARNGVQVRLDDGSRLFAEHLDGNAKTKSLDLKGNDVAIVRANVIADQMRELKIDDESKTVRGTGPGRFRYFETSVVPATTERIERPSPTEGVAMHATWSESLAFDETKHDGGGQLDLTGRVRVRSEPNASENGRLDADRLRLDFEASENEEARTLTKLTADGDALMESRAWATAAHEGEPRLFRITGGHVEYEPATKEATVEGAGSLLVHDPKRVNEPKRPSMLFGGEGTSRFKWTSRMSMRRTVADRSLIVMEKDVEVLHAGIEDGDTFSLTGDRMEITLARENEGEREAAAEGVDLGGPATLLRVRGLGHVFIRSPEHDVECEEFDYNVETQIAMLRARAGRVVTIQPRNAATPIRAELVQWDLGTGRLRILKGEGAVSQ
jgi:hypothetical protein